MDWARRTFLGAAGLLPLVGSASSAHATDDTVDQFMSERVQSAGIPGAGVAVVRGGRTLKCAGYGRQSLELDLPATAETVFAMASSSKMVAALVAGTLREAGRLDLDGSIRLYLPEAPDTWTDITVAHMLSHTSGLVGPTANPAFVEERTRRERTDAYAGDLKLDHFTDEELLHYGAAAPLRERPGSVWRYSQYPYFLFGLIVSRLTGQSYWDYAGTAVLEPLGMTRSSYGDHRTVVPGRLSTNYTRQFGPLQNFALRYTPGYWPAAGLNTSPADLTRLFEGLRPGRLLSANTLQRLWTPVTLSSGRVVNYGLGFTLTDHAGQRWVGHEGGGCCYVAWWPEAELGVGILLNLSGSKQDGIEQALGVRLLHEA